MLTTYERHGRAKLLATVLSIIVIAGVIVIANHLKSKSPVIARTTTTSSNIQSSGTGSTSNSSSAANSSNEADGSYSASSSYFVPSGQQSIEVSLTLKSGVITSVSIQNSEGDPTSAQFQQDFASQYKSYVVGQKISSLQLSVIAGASDTTQGFNNDLNQILNKASA